MSVTLHNDDCLTILHQMESNSIDSIVTDPPAGISFMGKKWDHNKGGRDKWIKWMTEIAAECLRVTKPGGHALVWAIPRTSHWTATAWEDGGFEIRDVVNHIFGSGFPKSTKQRDGWGTALKPACENWILCRKPISEATIAANVLRWGTGAINIDGCRVALETGETIPINKLEEWSGFGQKVKPDYTQEINTKGRFPANVIHDGSDEVVSLFPQGKSGMQKKPLGVGGMFSSGNGSPCAPQYGDSGSAARFFYCTKATKQDRDEWLDGEGKQYSHDGRDKTTESPYQRNDSIAKNNHPTVKSTSLMRYLCRLITPPYGIVLDPFMGSGSTGKGALRESFSFIGIEKELEYFEIAKKRIEYETIQERL